MNAQELRIGNLVERDGNILEVVRIAKDNIINYDLILQSKGMHVNSGNVIPIPLTEEWLVKFGFYYSDDENEFLELQLMHKTKLYADNSNEFSTVVLKIKENEIEIEYVHQLQNLYFALTGKELTL